MGSTRNIDTPDYLTIGIVGCEPAAGLDADWSSNPLKSLYVSGSIRGVDSQTGTISFAYCAKLTLSLEAVLSLAAHAEMLDR